MFDLNDLLLEIGKGSRTSVVSNSGLVEAANFEATTSIGDASVLLDIDVAISDAQLKAGGPFDLITGIPGKLLTIVSFQGYMRIEFGGGTNISALNVRYKDTAIGILPGFSLLTGVASNDQIRYSRNSLTTINTQTTLNLAGVGIEMTTSGTAAAGFASFSGGYHCLITYLSVLQG